MPQGSWSWQNPKPSGNPLFAISCPSATVCFAAGYDWPVEVTANAGGTWTPQGTNQFLNGISCPSTAVCVAVGDFGLVRYTADGGANWFSTSVNGGNFLSGVSCATTLICFADGAGGSILRTANGGATWTPLTSGTAHDLFQISCPSTTSCVAVGASGAITWTANGANWTLINTTGLTPFYGVSCSTTTDCIAVDATGYSQVSKDGGATWTGHWVAGPVLPLTSVSCVAPRQCFATGADGSVYVQTPCNGDPSQVGCWVRSSTSESGVLYAISCESATVCFAAGDYGIIVATSNGATGWHHQSPNIFPGMLAMSCPSTSVCYAVGFAPTIEATADGGTSWSSQPSNVPYYDPSIPPQYNTVLRGVSCPSTTTCFAVGDVGAIVGTTDSGGHWSVQTSGINTALESVSCPSVSVCFAVGTGGVIVVTSNGGSSWAVQASGTTSELDAIDCPTTSLCYVGGHMDSSLGTTDGGAHWSAQGATNSANLLTGISCPSSTTCFAIADVGTIHVTTDSGATWSSTGPTYSYNGITCTSSMVCTAVTSNDVAVHSVDGSTWVTQTAPHAPMVGVSCPSTTTCFAAGLNGNTSGIIAGNTDGSATPWKLLAPSGTVNDVNGISCPSSTTCFATANYSILRTTNSGVGWFEAKSLLSAMFAISCPSTTTCFAVGHGSYPGPLVVGTIDGGDTWSDQVLAPAGNGPYYVSVSCPSITVCFAVDLAGNFIKTVDGSNWSTPAPTGASLFTGISCPSTSVCFASDGVTPGHIYSTTDGGASWGVSWSIATDLAAGSGRTFSAIDCPSDTNCYATGSAGLLAVTSDGGANWRTGNSPSPALLGSLSCPTVSECYATAVDDHLRLIGGINGTLLHTTNFGATWEVQYSGQADSLFGVSCPSAAGCFAVGARGAIVSTSTSGAAWTTARPAESIADIQGMSCYGTNNCYAAATDTLFATHNGGSAWATTKLTNGDIVDSVSCPGANTCYAVGWPGAIYKTTNGGANWNALPNTLYGSDETLLGVSCASTTSCVAVGIFGKVLSTSDGTNWNPEASGTTGHLFAVSCPSSSSCIAVGGGGLALTRTSGSWHAYPSGTTSTLHGVNCPSINTCYAVGTAGTIRVTTNRGATWIARASSTTGALNGVACLAPTYCVAVGDFGAVLATVDGATWHPRPAPVFNTLRATAFPDLNHSWLAGYGGAILANPGLIPSCSSVSVAPDVPSPQTQGALVTLNATAFGCAHPNPLFRFYIRTLAGVWSVVRDFSPTSSFAWNTSAYPPGTYTLEVSVKDTSSGFAYDAYTIRTFTVKRPPCTSASVAAGALSPQTSGTTVTFTASATGCPTPQFEWWINKAGVWSVVPGHDYAHSSNTLAWNTTGLANGTYQLGVWARQQYSTAKYEAYADWTFTVAAATGTTRCQAVNITPAAPSPVVKGNTVVFTASQVSCDTPQFEWWLRNAAGVWAIVKPYSGANTYTLPATAVAGTYLVDAWVRQTGSAAKYEAFGYITYTVINPAVQSCTSVNVAPDLAAPQSPGSTITFTATAAGCNSPVFQFYLLPPGGAWTLKQAYQSLNTLTWDTSGLSPGRWQLSVVAKQSGSTATYQSYQWISYQLTFG